MSAVECPKVSIVAPCYNEEGVLEELRRRLTAVCAEVVGDNYEIVLVDDGSKDKTRAIIGEFCDADPHFTGVFLSRNHGQQAALSAGLNVCRGERILIIDADLQDPPELLGQMMQMMDEGADVVYGQRIARDGETRFKKLTSSLFYKLLGNMIEVEIPRNTGDFRLMSRRVLDELNRLPERNRFVRGLVSWVGFNQVPLQYHRHARYAGETKWSVRALFGIAIDAMTSFSVMPLKLATYMGVLAAMVGVFMMGWTVYSYFSGIAIRGWTTIIAPMLILGSTQLLVLGVIGEYLGRLYMEAKGRPLFIIDEIRRQQKGAKAPVREVRFSKSADDDGMTPETAQVKSQNVA